MMKALIFQDNGEVLALDGRGCIEVTIKPVQWATVRYVGSGWVAKAYAYPNPQEFKVGTKVQAGIYEAEAIVVSLGVEPDAQKGTLPLVEWADESWC